MPLAADLLARHLGLTRSAALERLAEAPSVIADAVDSTLGAHLAGLLRSCGMGVRLEGAEPAEGVVDLSIQLVMPIRVQRMMRLISRETGLPLDEVADGLRRPGGLVMHGLARAEAQRIRGTLGRAAFLSVTVSDPAGAIYDVFAPKGHMTPALADRLRLIGAVQDPITGAVAIGLDHDLRERLVRQDEGARLLVLDRAFQRYDMYLTWASGWVCRDLADFLVSRTGLPRSRFEVMSHGRPLRIESGLTYAAARQFRADYGAIGLETRMVLSGLAENADNPVL